MNQLDDLLDNLVSEQDLSVSLRKAKVLAYKLGNHEFKKWVDNELNGYSDEAQLPSYRKKKTVAMGDFISPRYKITGHLIPITHVPEKYRSYFTDVDIIEGIKELESMLEKMNKGGKENTLRIAIPPEISGLLHSKVFEYSQCMGAWKILNPQTIVGIIETTRNVLLTFVLELSDKYPELKNETIPKKKIPNEEITQLFKITIHGGHVNLVGTTDSVIQTETMTTFNQQGQNVNNQQNIGDNFGTINFGTINNANDFVAELQKMKAELSRAALDQTIDGEIVTDTDYQLTKAMHEAEKPMPDKSKLLKHLENAKGYADSITSLVKAGTAIGGAIEIASKIF